ncbi:MAG TPA: hypothetical protein PLJ60_01860 [Chryseolinea sp.]|nr:hypothetical protein [Chryseolinea sp.]HPM29054.1 hypothetical protein [Chryseolinea sp.]
MIFKTSLKKYKILIVLVAVILQSCNEKYHNDESTLPTTSLQGTWKLISETKIENSDTTFVELKKDREMIKILNETHFSFLNHDTNKGKDSTATFVAGGGQYTLKGNQYKEYLSYCSAREWEGNSFDFTVIIQNDTLIQSGREKIEGTTIDRIIIEKYSRVK